MNSVERMDQYIHVPPESSTLLHDTDAPVRCFIYSVDDL